MKVNEIEMPKTQVNPCQVNIRAITEDDHPFLGQLYASTRAEEMATLDWSKDEKDIFLNVQFWAQHKHYQTQYADATFELLSLGSQPIGRLYVHRQEAEIRIVDITLLPEYRNHGLGSYFLNQLIKEAEQTHKTITIHVEKFNPAIRLYKRLGFRQINTHGIYNLMVWQAN